MLNKLLNGFTSPKEVPTMVTAIELDIKNISLANIQNDVSNVIETLQNVNNLYMAMFENGSFLNVAFACFVTAKMYKDKKHVQTINGIEYTRKELLVWLEPFLTNFKNKDVGKTIKSLMAQLYERRVPLATILKGGYVIEGLRSTKNYIDAHFELDGRKKVINKNDDVKKPKKSENKKSSDDKTVNSVDTSTCETVEQAIQIHIDMLKKDYKLSDVELANLIVKQIMSNNKDIRTTSDKSVVAFKVVSKNK